MLSGSELTTAIAAVLIGAVVLGFLLHWLWAHLTRSPNSDSEQLSALAAQLHDADLAREEAEEAKQLADALLVRREAEFAGRLAQMQARLDGGNVDHKTEPTGEPEASRQELETTRAATKKAPKRVVKPKPKSKPKPKPRAKG